MTEKSRIVQSCYVKKTVNDSILSKKQNLNVKTLHRVLEVLIDEGFGEYSVRFGYDSNCAFTIANNDFDISNDCIYFKE